MRDLISIDHENGFVYIGFTETEDLPKGRISLEEYIVESPERIKKEMLDKDKSYFNICKELWKIYGTDRKDKGKRTTVEIDVKKNIIHRLRWPLGSKP